MAKDPVCGMQVDEKKAAASSVYKGTTYYFCAAACKATFDKSPEKFIGKTGMHAGHQLRYAFNPKSAKHGFEQWWANWELALPWFTWLSWESCFLGPAEIFLYGSYTTAVFVPLYNGLSRWTNEAPAGA